MSIGSALREGYVFFLKGGTKREVLHELSEFLACCGEVGSAEELEMAVLAREELMSTGIGLGMAVPHVRLKHDMACPRMAVGIRREGIANYDSLDGKPVRIVVLIAAGRRQHAQYIRLLAEVTSLLKSPEVREKLLNARDESEAYGILTGGAGKAR